MYIEPFHSGNTTFREDRDEIKHLLSEGVRDTDVTGRQTPLGKPYGLSRTAQLIKSRSLTELEWLYQEAPEPRTAA